MRIAFVSHPGYAVLPPAGSVEIGTREIARRLAETHDVTVYGSASPRTRDTTDGRLRYRFVGHRIDRAIAAATRPLWRLAPLRGSFSTSLLHPAAYWLRAAREIRRAGTDVIHVSNMTQALPFLRRLNPQARIVLHMHCEWLVQMDKRTLDRRLRHVDAIVGCSEHITAPIRRRFPELADRCRTIPNGVELRARPAPRPAGETVTVLHVGRISPEKGHHDLVDALNAVVRTCPQVRAVFVGEESVIPADWAVSISPDPEIRGLERFYDGSSYLEQVKARMSPELAERSTFVGRVAHAETAAHYAAADLFVFPSYFEAMPVPPIEAMAAGLPVIASRVGGAVESVRDGETGVLVDRADPEGLARAIVALVEDEALRTRLGAAGRERAERHFSWDGVAAAFERVLEGPVSHNRPAGAATAEVVVSS